MKVKAFALDPLFLFLGVLFILVGILISMQIINEMEKIAGDKPGLFQLKDFGSHFRELDWVIPFFVGSACVVMILYASMTGAVPISIVLFMIMSLIVDIIIVYMNDFNLGFFDMNNAVTPLNMPLTHFTLTWLPAILTIVMIIMGILMHTRSQY